MKDLVHGGRLQASKQKAMSLLFCMCKVNRQNVLNLMFPPTARVQFCMHDGYVLGYYEITEHAV